MTSNELGIAAASYRRGMFRRLWRPLAGLVLVGLLAAVAPTGYVLAASAGRLSTVAEAPAQPVAIVFGAGLDANGRPMPFLQARLDLAAELYRAGKVRVILVSGDNRKADYNEPDAMRAALIDQGIPPQQVVADYAGLDTYATCVRATRIFGIDRAILVSQSYHLPRAVATCRSVGVDAWGVGDDTARAYTDKWGPFAAREWPANAKLSWDLVSRRQPILGPVETSVTEAAG